MSYLQELIADLRTQVNQLRFKLSVGNKGGGRSRVTNKSRPKKNTGTSKKERFPRPDFFEANRS